MSAGRNFSRVNDVHGKAFGDVVLQQLAERLAGVLRGGDAVLRFGDDRFLLLPPRIGLATGAAIAERARKAVQLPELTVASVELKITVSVGVAARQLKESRDGLIERLAPLKAKRAGKNRVALAR